MNGAGDVSKYEGTDSEGNARTFDMSKDMNELRSMNDLKVWQSSVWQSSVWQSSVWNNASAKGFRGVRIMQSSVWQSSVWGTNEKPHYHAGRVWRMQAAGYNTLNGETDEASEEIMPLSWKAATLSSTHQACPPWHLYQITSDSPALMKGPGTDDVNDEARESVRGRSQSEPVQYRERQAKS